MVSAGSYILSAALLAILVLSLGFSAVGLRRWLMPASGRELQLGSSRRSCGWRC